ncbi:hypothetical protein SAMN05444280_11089 [Tangfeifania diversioriginum]|uniref:Carboxypeptidase regulatory-like domain-containing protein n=1 Tax=Tangfeifania diversioriginum TaxID=1168035 RepID=A0A1M6GA76_9BACT|nr:carboxypeptidase-like regulatory domain-containing protein [Tangfeifania diversioriginum]SHJ06836.1 hypothetical protein SAMN05444280_11089 [Tangfeifania diversioriginum]
MKPHHFFRFIFLSVCILLTACEKELQDIEVEVKLIDENDYPLADQSGAKIILSRGNEAYTGITDENGRYVFHSFPYGIFNVSLEKEGFISDISQPELVNHKGDSVWVHQFRMVEVPHFQLTIDSIVEQDFGDKLLAFGELFNTRGEPAHQYGARVFFSNTPDVSKDNYLYYHFGTLLKRLIHGGRYEMWITSWFGSLIQGDYDTLYVKVYPCAFYNDWLTLREEGLGTPSEVFEWKVPEH